MDQLQTRLDALEHQVKTLNRQTYTVKRQLHWWRGLACGAVVLAVLTWALPAGTGQQEPPDGGPRGLAQRVAALEDLLKHFSREKNEIFLTGANLHIVNGLGQTACGTAEEPIPDCPNGLGNLIVGYNEPRGEEENTRTGSHNVVVGQEHNFSSFGGAVIGRLNTISGAFAVVSGGELNVASGMGAAVTAGRLNTASGLWAAVSAGAFNTASELYSSVSGGTENAASGDGAAISGGSNNTATSLGAASVSGGIGNIASGPHSSVCGGQENIASQEGSAVCGGLFNTASGDQASVCGGLGNTASGVRAAVSGGQNLTQATDFGWSAGSEAEEVVVGNVRSP
jgi:hypothetical protein